MAHLRSWVRAAGYPSAVAGRLDRYTQPAQYVYTVYTFKSYSVESVVSCWSNMGSRRGQQLPGLHHRSLWASVECVSGCITHCASMPTRWL